jgi:transposase-like protein
MASQEINDKKREEMSATILILKHMGWTIAQLAALMDVSESTVRAWQNARSMGTNAQRDDLKRLGPPSIEAPRRADKLEARATEEDEASLQAKFEGAHEVAEGHAARALHLIGRAAALRKLVR